MSILCYKLSGILKAQTPLHIGSGLRTGVIKRTKGIIPGSTLRGAIGTSLIKCVCQLQHPFTDHSECQHFTQCSYPALFGEESGKAANIFFRYAYPVHLKCMGTYLPAPKNIYICKNPQCKKTYKTFFSIQKCDCGEDLKPYRGFQCSRCGELNEYPIGFYKTTSTALDRNLVSAATIGQGDDVSGTLHTTESIAKGSTFSFEVIISAECGKYIDSFRGILENGLSDEGIGGGKSRGFGKVSLENLNVKQVVKEDLRKRASEIDSGCFVVRLLSPMLLDKPVLDDKNLLEGCRRSYTYLFREGKPALADVKSVSSFVGPDIFTGWSLKENRRRRIEPALSSGSMFKFEGKSDDETLSLSLAALELHALGSYKPHGCGQVKIEFCH